LNKERKNLKRLKKISIKCKFGIHDWKRIDKKEVELNYNNCSKSFNTQRHYRICTKCHKCQYAGYDFQDVTWTNAPEEETNNLLNGYRYLKLERIKNNIT